MKNADPVTLDELGQRTVNALYPDDYGLEEIMDRDDFGAVCRLIPFMQAGELSALVSVGEIGDPSDLIALARRVTAVGSPSVWLRALNGAVAQAELLQGVVIRIDELPRDVAAYVLESTLAALERTIQAPDEWLEEPVTVISWDVSEQQLAVRSSDAVDYTLEVPDDLASAAAGQVAGGAIDLLAACEADGTWSLVSLPDASGEVVTTQDPPSRVPTEARDAAVAVIEAVALQGEVHAKQLETLMGWMYPRASDWAAALDVVAAALRRGLAEPDDLAEAIVGAGQHVRGSLAHLEEREEQSLLATAALGLIGASCGLDATVVRSQSVGLLGISIGLIPTATPAAQARFAGDLHRARACFKRKEIFTLVRGHLPKSYPDRRRVIEVGVEPVDPAEALALYLSDMENIAQEIEGGEDDASSTRDRVRSLVRYLTMVDALVTRSPTERAKKLLLSVPLVPISTYAGPLVLLVERLGVELDPSTEFLTASTAESAESLAATCKLLTRMNRTSDGDLDPVLMGIGRAALRRDALAPEVDEFQRLLQGRVPRLEQYARIATLLGWRAAERAAGRENLLSDLLDTAAELLRTDLSRATARMKLADGWMSSTFARRRTAAKSYELLLASARSERQLVAVVESAQRFFSEGPVEKAKLRRASYGALVRVYRKSDPTPTRMPASSWNFDGGLRVDGQTVTSSATS